MHLSKPNDGSDVGLLARALGAKHRGKPLARERASALLDRWVGSDVTIRVVSEGDILLLVFQGRLGARVDSKHPALFWPLHASDQRDHFEQPGIYLHPHVFHEAVEREGGFVIELRQATTTLNIRRL